MKTLNRIKKQKRPFTAEYFYIHESGNQVYQFRDRDSHMIISTACDLDTMETYIRRVLTRYKNYDHYLKAISSMSEKTVTEKDHKKREQEYKKRGKEYLYIIDRVIKDYYSAQSLVEDHKKKRLETMTSIPTTTKDTTPTTISPRPLHKRRKKSRL